MYNIKKDVKVSDFTEDTKDFLMKAGFSKEDDISEMFSHFLYENKLNLNFENLYEHTKIFALPEQNVKTNNKFEYVCSAYTVMYDVLKADKQDAFIMIDKPQILGGSNVNSFESGKLGGVC